MYRSHFGGSAMTTPTFRDSIRKSSPRWLQGYWGERLLYVFGLHLDGFVDSLVASIKLRFANLYSNETLTLIGRERGLVRGFIETDQSYGDRLDGWWEMHKRRGNPYTLMDALAALLVGYDVPMRIVNNNAAWFSRAADGTRSYHRAANWNWDNHPEKWSRFWVILYPPPSLWVAATGTWGDGTVWADEADATWGSTATSEQVSAICNLIQERQAAHSRCINVIIAFDSAAFDPTDTAPPLPDGTWEGFGIEIGGVMVPARDSRAIYWRGND